MKKIVLLGPNGQVGISILRVAPQFNNLQLIPLSRKQIDLTQTDSIFEKILESKADIVINSASYTTVDKAEEEKELAMNVNGHAVKEIAKACETLGASLLQISTDYVFDGEKETEYLPSDHTNPLNTYGRTKLTGEQNALEYCSKTIVLRTSWVHSKDGHNFETTMRRLFQEKDELKIVNDQHGRPTKANDLAIHCLELCEQAPFTTNIKHFAGPEIMSWYELACSLKNDVGASISITPIKSSEYPTQAARPKRSILNISASSTSSL